MDGEWLMVNLDY